MSPNRGFPSGIAAGPHVKRVRVMFSAIARHGVSELRDGEIAPAWARRSDKSPRFSLTKSVIQKSGNGNFAPADCYVSSNPGTSIQPSQICDSEIQKWKGGSRSLVSNIHRSSAATVSTFNSSSHSSQMSLFRSVAHIFL